MNEVFANLKTVGWQFLYVILITGSAYALATLAWMLCLKTQNSGIGFHRFYAYRAIGEALAMINPSNFIAGDGAKSVMIKKHGIPGDEALSSVILSRALLMLSSIIMLICCSFFYLDGMEIVGHPALQIAGMGLVCLINIGIIYLFVSPKLLLSKWVYSLLKIFSKRKARRRIRSVISTNRAMSGYFRDHKIRLLGAFILSVAHWLLGATEFLILMKLLGYEVSLLSAILFEMALMLLKSLGSFVPGQLGIEEYSNKILLQIIGISTSGVWMAFSLLRRARQIIWLGIGSLLFLLLYRKL